MKLPREILLLVLGLCTVGPLRTVLANTEIVNFEASLGPDIPHLKATDWPVLSPTNTQALLRVLPAPLDTSIVTVCEPLSADALGSCPHEAWVAIDTDESSWSQYSKFTLRISWPASYPAGFFIDLYSPEDLPSTSPKTRTRHTLTRRKYARIRLVSEGVFTPSPANEGRTVEPVPFIVAVEPLILGLVPESLLPTLLLLLALVVVAGSLVLPRILKHLVAVAAQVRVESATAAEKRRQ
ncbi:uncharacterized protein TRAVEDRAFT_16119 [Trametes versicolor FP-101664 SS1]|uniref:uncharacterized protein n=1 Tax=Trametes versicolor (strain FP-101664) TaxID=717944 RepID=UPI0004622366|nr:uncharacterized protein TRAVEDRAFT_16119 [Trametes versicolor FP-101664 SS1]EIW63847.1 hypothetical protein TRAVEDRAFT_16119 [Trametes versicolor FP-101664 SS1]